MTPNTNFKYLTNLIFFIFISSFFILINFDMSNVYANNIDKLTCLQFNTLIAFPDKMHNAPPNTSSINFEDSKLTVLEFENILQQLYSNNYILVNIEDITNHSEQVKNKKPIILTFDNVTYKSNYQNIGEIDKIIIDRNNNLATYTTKKSIQDRVQYNNEFMLILESFIKAHPDFSYNNARGIIFLTGENGILGYNTNQKNASHRYERKKVMEVIFKLKSLGWKFGCNNYSYQQNHIFDDLKFAKDLSLWNKEVKSLIGNTAYFAYPQESYNKENAFREKLLLSNDFKFIFSNDTHSECIKYTDHYHISRIPINGLTLRTQSDKLSHLFNCEKVYDHNNRSTNFFQLTS